MVPKMIASEQNLIKEAAQVHWLQFNAFVHQVLLKLGNQDDLRRKTLIADTEVSL